MNVVGFVIWQLIRIGVWYYFKEHLTIEVETVFIVKHVVEPVERSHMEYKHFLVLNVET